MIPAKANPVMKKKAEIYTIGYSERMIEKDGFKVLVDANGDILTDMQLLAKLRTLRQTIAQENGVARLASCTIQYWYYWRQTDR